ELIFSDSLTGTMKQSARLDLAQPFELLKADVNSRPQVVTQVVPGSAGVELREPNLRLEGQGRLAMAGQIPVSAWGAEMSAVSWNLALPPGWSLLYARGADSASGSWVTLWGLFDIFMVLIIVIALGKILRPWVGALALLCLLITYQRSGAAVASWLNLAAVLALLPWVSGGFARWLKRYAWLSFASLVLILLSFSIAQVRYALYPQLESSAGEGGFMESVFEDTFAMRKMEQAPMPMAEAPAAPLASMAEAPGIFDGRLSEEEIVVTGVRASLPKKAGSQIRDYAMPSASQQIDPTQQTQTGSGVPQWNHNRVYLSWSGPVTADQTTHLYWVPPWINRPGYLLAAILPWLLAFALWQGAGLLRIKLPSVNTGRALSLLLLAAVMGLGSAAPDTLADEASGKTPSLRGAEPSPELLKELKERLLKAPLCLPDCVSIEAVTLQVKEDSLRLELV
ncbi:MAG TPA: hypothetical protein PKC70_17925, partial [Cellvibrionaceae bacterium]|nr:hypothetical protein [Cellvibrionaceae bacterium]